MPLLTYAFLLADTWSWEHCGGHLGNGTSAGISPYVLSLFFTLLPMPLIICVSAVTTIPWLSRGFRSIVSSEVAFTRDESAAAGWKTSLYVISENYYFKASFFVLHASAD